MASWKRSVAGVAIVVGIAASWVGSTQYTQFALRHSSFDAPFFSVWFSTAWLALVFPIFLLGYSFVGTQRNATSERAALIHVNEAAAPKPEGLYESILCDLLHYGHGLHWEPEHDLKQRFWLWLVGYNGAVSRTTMAAFRLSLPFLLLWMGANYSYSRALIYISATDVTAIFAATPAMVYLLSFLLLAEPFMWLRMLAVAMTVAGVVLVALAERLHHLKPEGVLLTVSASCCAALYKVLLKVYLQDATAASVALFMSLLAMVNLVLLWPVWLLLQQQDVEAFSFDRVPWQALCLGALLSLLVNFLINFGIAFTYPLFISIGTVLGTPINAVVDWQVHNIRPGWMTFTGCGCVMIAFVLLLLTGVRQRGNVTEITIE
eukprot:TRINITY_DN5573_c0_g1_i2.p2 TRINITY_DN5573_c0_g1~~TRINITY_DN5573_c0_g1_i2.p2  ORF type:complete len:376 (+),score=34.19 TRINITY_DN5573_c0_g1_i2:1481-2608(+)